VGVALAIAVAFSSYDRKPSTWLAAILAVPAGPLVQAIVGWLLVPTISRKELPPGCLHWEPRRGQPHELELTGKGRRHVHN
jgi:hypothetical protein